jgi:hypothetical protein
MFVGLNSTNVYRDERITTPSYASAVAASSELSDFTARLESLNPSFKVNLFRFGRLARQEVQYATTDPFVWYTHTHTHTHMFSPTGLTSVDLHVLMLSMIETNG